jgi:hypothetical protein
MKARRFGLSSKKVDETNLVRSSRQGHFVCGDGLRPLRLLCRSARSADEGKAKDQTEHAAMIEHAALWVNVAFPRAGNKR